MDVGCPICGLLWRPALLLYVVSPREIMADGKSQKFKMTEPLLVADNGNIQVG